MTNTEFNEVFRKRTKAFAVRILNFISAVPFNTTTRIMTFQLGKSGASAGANFRAFCEGRSKNEKYSKICIVVEESDECLYWLELFIEMGIGDVAETNSLLTEAGEIVKITSKIRSAFAP